MPSVGELAERGARQLAERLGSVRRVSEVVGCWIQWSGYGQGGGVMLEGHGG